MLETKKEGWDFAQPSLQPPPPQPRPHSENPMIYKHLLPIIALSN